MLLKLSLGDVGTGGTFRLRSVTLPLFRSFITASKPARERDEKEIENDTLKLFITHTDN
jgi:hypothetical protein